MANYYVSIIDAHGSQRDYPLCVDPPNDIIGEIELNRRLWDDFGDLISADDSTTLVHEYCFGSIVAVWFWVKFRGELVQVI